MSRETRQDRIKVGDVVLDGHSCVLRHFDEMQQARKTFFAFHKSFPQFALPFMYADDLPKWPVRVKHACWQCEGSHARSWSFPLDQEKFDTIHICESCRVLQTVLVIAYPKGRRLLKLIPAEEAWEEVQGFENDWAAIQKRAGQEESSMGRFIARISHVVTGPPKSAAERFAREQATAAEAEKRRVNKEAAKKQATRQKKAVEKEEAGSGATDSPGDDEISVDVELPDDFD